VAIAGVLQIDAAMLDTVLRQPITQPDRAQQLHRRVFRMPAGCVPARNPRAGFDDHGVEAVGGEQVRQQHACRPAPMMATWVRTPVSERDHTVVHPAQPSTGRKCRQSDGGAIVAEVQLHTAPSILRAAAPP